MTAAQQVAVLVRALEGCATFDGPWVLCDPTHEALALRAVERFLGERAKVEVLEEALDRHRLGKKDYTPDELTSRSAVISASSANARRHAAELRRRAQIREAFRRRYLCAVDDLTPTWCEVIAEGGIAVGGRVEVRNASGGPSDRPLARWTPCRVVAIKAGLRLKKSSGAQERDRLQG